MKKVLQDISNSGYQWVFGKGQLEWTEDQSSIINAERTKGYCKCGAWIWQNCSSTRITNLIDGGIEPSKIWLVSFTRTAVAELRDRISLFSDTEAILGVKIATIDSRAWNARFGFREEEVKNYFKVMTQILMKQLK